jgi:hypothetical protein
MRGPGWADRTVINLVEGMAVEPALASRESNIVNLEEFHLLEEINALDLRSSND